MHGETIKIVCAVLLLPGRTVGMEYRGSPKCSRLNQEVYISSTVEMPAVAIDTRK